MTAIVTVNVSQTIAPAPSTLQKTGAFISQGGTNTTPGTRSLLATAADLTPLLKTTAAITSVILSTAQITTFTTTQIHGLPIGDVIQLTIAGVTAQTTAGIFNGTFLCTITGTSTFTAPITGTAQTGTGGTYINSSSPELVQMATTFFAQGAQQGVYVLELGAGNPAEGVAFLRAWITANPNVLYSYLVPRLWDGQASFLDLLGQFEATTSKTYFFVTTTLSNYPLYNILQKSCFAMIESPTYGVHAANALTDITFSGAWGANVITNTVWAATNGGQVTYTTTTAHGIQPGQVFSVTGSTPAGYNLTNAVALVGTTASTLVAALLVDPGAISVEGTVSASVAGFATATSTTAHGVAVGQYFKVSGALGATIPDGYNGYHLALTGTTGSTLVYALPADPGASTLNGTLVASFYANAGTASTEFSVAAAFWVTLNYNPSTTNKVTPTAFSFLFGVTPFPTQGNAAILQTLQDSFINVVGTGAQGGISTAILLYGVTRDGRDFTYWYSVDWVQINIAIAISNAIINGSNNTLNPLYYNQDGINRLQQVASTVLGSGLTFGLVLGTVKQVQLNGPAFTTALNAGDFSGFTVINAVPFVPYSQANPSDYALGQYQGLSAVYVPTRGFVHIVFNVNVTDFVAA